MLKSIQVIVTDERLTDLQMLPRREHESAGIDLRAMFPGDGPLVLSPRTATLIPTGLRIWVRDTNYVGLIYPRSGTGHKRGIVLGNGVGVIDADYQGPLMISALNRTDLPVSIELGERIAQFVVTPVERPEIAYCEDFEGLTVRADGGFGSTGHK